MLYCNGMKITFHGAAREVTGSCTLVETDRTRVLVDCGLIQGSHDAYPRNLEPFPLDPSTIDAVIVTHAHIDHIGRIPKLVQEGFSGRIYSTKPTRALANPMLQDAADILSKNRQFNLDRIYSLDNINKAFLQWLSFEYNEKVKITD